MIGIVQVFQDLHKSFDPKPFIFGILDFDESSRCAEIGFKYFRKIPIKTVQVIFNLPQDEVIPMIVPCHSCQSTFRLDSGLVKPDGTLVKCSKCREIFKVYPPEAVDPRKYSRVKTRNLISIFSFDKSGNLISQGLGIAMDISKGGILLETPISIKPGMLVLSATDRDNNLMELRGKLIHSTQSTTGTYLSGIEFIGVDGRVRDFITRLIKEYNFRGSNLFIAVTRKAARSGSPSISLS